MKIACAINSEYVQHFCVLIKSILINTSENRVFVYVLHNDLTSEDMNQVCNLLNDERIYINYILIDEKKLIDIPIVADHLTIQTLYRLLLPEILEKDVKKLIYIDCDMVVKDDLLKIWNIELGDYPLAAVNDVTNEMYKVLELQSKDDYFNAGFLLINLKKWREENYFKKFIEYTNSNPEKIYYADQDILNGFFYGNWMRIHPKWNVQNIVFSYPKMFLQFFSEEVLEETKNNVSIIHYSGKYKPWDLFCNQELWEEYFKVLSLLKNNISKDKCEFIWDEDNEVYIFGTGKLGKNVAKYLDVFNLKYEGFLDNDSKKWGELFKNKKIFKPSDIICDSVNKKKILVASMYSNEIIEDASRLSFDKHLLEFIKVEPGLRIVDYNK